MVFATQAPLWADHNNASQLDTAPVSTREATKKKVVPKLGFVEGAC